LGNFEKLARRKFFRLILCFSEILSGNYVIFGFFAQDIVSTKYAAAAIIFKNIESRLI